MTKTKTKPDLSRASIYHILKKYSRTKRISDDAADELRIVLEGTAERITKHAGELSSHANRKTIRSDDIRLAAKHLKL